MFRQAVRTVAAILGGYLTTLALTAAGFIIVALIQDGGDAAPDLAWRALLILIAILAGIAGGYTGAWIAGRREIRHGLYVGGLTALVGLAWGNVNFAQSDPLAFRIALIVIAPPSAFLGGWLRAHRQKLKAEI
jgi:putative membrane protein (TIGR04086 family)